MFEKTKEVVREHKKEIIAGVGIAIIGAGIGLYIGKAIGMNANKDLVELGKQYLGKETLSWEPGKGCLKLEEVKKFLDLNAENNAMFAIFREGTEPDAYLGLLLDNAAILPETV